MGSLQVMQILLWALLYGDSLTLHIENEQRSGHLVLEEKASLNKLAKFAAQGVKML